MDSILRKGDGIFSNYCCSLIKANIFPYFFMLTNMR
jgi:hypothetical protein